MIEFDHDAVSRELDAAIWTASKALRDEFGLRPTVVDVAYTDDGYGDGRLFEKLCEDRRSYAAGLGIEYRFRRLDEREGGRLSGLLDQLSGDPDVHGIRLTGWNLHRGEESNAVYAHIDADKDIDGRSDHNRFESLGGWWVRPRPRLGAIKRIVDKAVPGGLRALEGRTISILDHDVNNEDCLAIGAFFRRAKANVATCYYGARGWDAFAKWGDVLVVNVREAGRINRTHVKENALVIDLSDSWTLGKAGAVDLDDVRAVAAAVVSHRAIYAIETREPYVSLLRTILWRKGNRGLGIERLLR